MAEVTDDQCDLETLTAMLSDSDGEDQCAEKVAQEDGTGLFESSDDEDEEELDRLAALIEQEDSSHKKEDHSHRKGENAVDEQSEGKSQKIEVAQNSHQTEVAQNSPQNLDVKSSLDLQEELRKMQERVLQLQAQLSGQSNVTSVQNSTVTVTQPQPKQVISSSAAESRTSGNKPTSSSSQEKDMMKKKPSSTSNKNSDPNACAKAKKVSPLSLREVEENIFFDPPSEKNTKKPSTPGVHQKNRPSNNKTQTRQKENHTHHDSDSDWEDMDGEKPNLSTAGSEIKSLLKSGEKKRIAHAPSCTYDKEGRKQYQHKMTWKSKLPDASTEKSSSSLTSDEKYQTLAARRDAEAGITREAFSGIRLVNPLVSSSVMKMRMENRRMIKMSRLHSQINTKSTESDWVTIGVIVSKSDTKTSAKGNQYSIWKVCDLEDCEKTVSLFLFGDTHKNHWKTVTGMVVGLLNPSVMPNKEKQSSEICLSVDHPQKIMMIGTSKDLGVCRGVTKAGRKCTAFINVCQGEFCSYHVQAAYKKTSAKRSELQASYTGHVPKSFEKKIFGKKDSTVYYQGLSYSSCAPPQKKKSNQVSLKSIKLHDTQLGGAASNAKVSTASLHKLLPEDEAAIKQLKQEAKESNPKSLKDERTVAFHDMLSRPTVGSMNLVKHLVAKDETEKKTEAKQKGQSIISVSASDMIKMHRQEMQQKKQQHQQQPSATAASPKADPLKLAPKLGRGFSSGDDIFLDDSPKTASASDKAKLKALAKIRAKGGIKREDPNEIIKKNKSPETKEAIKKRVSQHLEDDSSSDNHSDQGPPKKKSRLLGDLDIESEEVKKMLQAGSSHKGAQAEIDQEREELYFNGLEKKEKMEEKMASVLEQKCTVYSCYDCKYTAFALAERCKEENHSYKKHGAVKRFYKCKDCKRRTISFNKYPSEACSGCGGSTFERTSMLKERKGPKLPHEELLLRGEERKFVNS